VVYTVALLVLTIGVLWLVRGGPLRGSRVPTSQTPDRPDAIEVCNITEPGCVDRITRPPKTPVDPTVLTILLDDEIVGSFIGNGRAGVDYWLSSTPITGGDHGDQGAMVALVLARAVSFEGLLPQASNPCEGKGVEGHVDPNDPCRTEPRTYGSVLRSFSGVRFFITQVDTGRNEVVSIEPMDLTDESIAELIDYLSGPTPAPTDPEP
jgi:hypothetical protein